MVSTGQKRSLLHQAWKRWLCRHVACLSRLLLLLACYDAEANTSHPQASDGKSCMVTTIAMHTMSLYPVAQFRSVDLALAYIDSLLLGQLSHGFATLREATTVNSI